MGKRMKDTLVIDALIQTYGKQHLSTGLIVHTNQDSQFKGRNFRFFTD